MSGHRRNGRVSRIREVDRSPIEPFVPMDQRVTGRCLRCGAVTHRNKPYCIVHLAHLPRVAGILAKIERSQSRWARRIHGKQVRERAISESVS